MTHWTEQEWQEWQAKKKPILHRPGQMIEEPDEGPESDLQRKIKKYCREVGYLCLSLRQSKKAKGLITPGWPDMTIMVHKGKTIYLELKSATGTFSKEQKHFRQVANWLGHEIHEVRSYKKFLEVINYGNTERQISAR